VLQPGQRRRRGAQERRQEGEPHGSAAFRHSAAQPEGARTPSC
jgi:hypothetical protein